MMMKYELRIILDITSEPEVDAKKFDTNYCNKALKIACNHTKMYQIISKVSEKIDQLGFDMNDRDIGKSKAFKDDCLKAYSIEFQES